MLRHTSSPLLMIINQATSEFNHDDAFAGGLHSPPSQIGSSARRSPVLRTSPPALRAPHCGRPERRPHMIDERLAEPCVCGATSCPAPRNSVLMVAARILRWSFYN